MAEIPKGLKWIVRLIFKLKLTLFNNPKTHSTYIFASQSYYLVSLDIFYNIWSSFLPKYITYFVMSGFIN